MSNPNRNRNPRILLCDAWLYPVRRPTASQERIDRARLHALADTLAGTDLSAVTELAMALAATPTDTEVIAYARASQTLARAFNGQVQP